MNSLHGQDLNWVGDGSNGSIEKFENQMLIGSVSAGTPFNVRASTGKAAEDYYFQVTILELKGHLSIGAVSNDEFHPGWKTKGMFYNGNLTNGSAALKVDWGPRFQTGDCLGVRVTPISGSLEVTFFKNGSSLGTGFRLPGSTNAVYYPCLHISGSASVAVETPEKLPSIALSTTTPSGFYGDWKMEKAWDGDNMLSIPVPNRITLKLAKEREGTIRMSFKVANSIGGNAKVEEEGITDMTIQYGDLMSTRMMPPPELQPLEQLFTAKKFTALHLDEDTKLTLSGQDVKTEWTRLVRTPQTLNRY